MQSHKKNIIIFSRPNSDCTAIYDKRTYLPMTWQNALTSIRKKEYVLKLVKSKCSDIILLKQICKLIFCC